MTESVRAISVRRLAAFAILGGAAFASSSPAEAQVAPVPAPGVAVPVSPVPVSRVPIEVTINVLNGHVVCQPERLRLPARDAITLRVVNRSAKPIMFAAPEFFQGSEGLRTDVITYDSDRGGFLIKANSTLPVLLTTPPAGEYYYACYELAEVSTVRGTGFIVVVPKPPGQAPPRR